MQSLMGYLFEPSFVKAYRKGGWEHAQYTEVAVNISDAQFQIDNTMLYGALMSSTNNCASRYLLNKRDTMDGLKVFYSLRRRSTVKPMFYTKRPNILSNLRNRIHQTFPVRC
jgi:hypothetical protein